MAQETTSETGPLDAASNNSASANASGTPGAAIDATLRGEHSAPQNVSAADGSDPEIQPSVPELKAAAGPSVYTVPKEAGGLQAGMARILEEVKLPERRESKAADDQVKKEQVVLLPQKETAPPEIKQAAPREDSAQKEKASSVFSLHTLKDDLQDVVRDKKISLVRAAALEQEKRAGQDRVAALPTEEQNQRKRRMLVMASATLVIILFIGAVFGIYAMMRQSAAPPAAPAETSLIFAERTGSFPIGTLSDVDVKRLLSQARHMSDSPLGSITRIVPMISQTDEGGAVHEQAATIEEFLRAIGASATPDLIRSFRGDFFLGIHTIDKNVPVLIIPIASYERAFAGMLAWEKTLNEDMSPIFTPVPAQATDPSGLLVERQFKDTVMRNYDARVLLDDTGSVQLLYSFPTRNILIIAESPNSFVEVLSRLRAARQL